jgi:Domain of unknown function (DUF4126)
MSELDLALSIALGIGLAAATGLRVFLPLLVVSAASYAGYLPVGDSFAWLATPGALVRLGVAAAVITDLPPLVKWATAVIAGGGIAGATQSMTALLRAKSTVFTGTLGNPVIATAESGGSLIISLLALAAPLAAILLIVVFFWLTIRLLRKITRGNRTPVVRNGS